MKHDELRSIAHNLADSLASGCGLLMGFFGDIFAEAANRRQGYIEVDFLGGTATGESVSPKSADEIRRCEQGLRDLCEKHGVPVSAQLTARFSTDRRGEHRIVVTVEDETGRKSVDEYYGMPAKRLKVLDELGRIRTERRPRNG